MHVNNSLNKNMSTITCQRLHQLSTKCPNKASATCTRTVCVCQNIENQSPSETDSFGHSMNFSTMQIFQDFANRCNFKNLLMVDTDKKSRKFRRKSCIDVEKLFFLFIINIFVPIVFGVNRGGNPPRVVASSITTVKAVQGETLTLPCMVSGNPFPHTVWWKDGEAISQDWKRFKQQRMSLMVRDAEVSDSGMYRCKAVNGFGSRDVQIQLQVRKEEHGKFVPLDQREPEKPIFSQPQKMRKYNLVKERGSLVRLRCKAKGKPRPQIQWYKNGNLTHIGTGSNPEKPQWTLVLRGVTPSSSGKYTCRVWNSAGEITFDYTLLVTGHMPEHAVVLDPHPVNTTARLGEKTSIQCRVRSIRRPTIKWIKILDRHSFKGKPPNNTLELKEEYYLILPTQETMKLDDGSYLNKLVISHATMRDAGSYICFGANTMGYNVGYAYLTVLPALGSNRNSYSGRSVSMATDQPTMSVPLIISLSLAIGLIIVSSVLAYCYCRSSRLNPAIATANSQSGSQETTLMVGGTFDHPATANGQPGENTSRESEYCEIHQVVSAQVEHSPETDSTTLFPFAPKPLVSCNHGEHIPCNHEDRMACSHESNVTCNHDDFVAYHGSEQDFSETMEAPPPPPPSQYSMSTDVTSSTRRHYHHRRRHQNCSGKRSRHHHYHQHLHPSDSYYH